MTELLSYTQEVMMLFRDMHKCLQHGNTSSSELESLTLAQLHVLLFLEHKEKVSMKQIAEEMTITPASATALVGKMVEKKYLERLEDPHDRRTVYIKLSEDTKHRIENMKNEKMHYYERIFSSLQEDERKEFLRVMKKIHTVACSLQTV